MASRPARSVGADPLGEARISGERVRAFFGLPIPESHREALEAYLRDAAAAAPEFRWTPAANLHLTVRFLGHLDRQVAEGIADAVEAERPAACELKLGPLGAFKRQGRLARVVWIGLAAGEEQARNLAARVEARCREAGLEPETRPFNAHLTLARARARDGAPLPSMNEPPDLPAWRAEELILYRSNLGRAGSVYEPLRRIRLG